MKNLTTQAHEYCKAVLQKGDITIDATAGNGHDTLFLASQVGATGSVYSFDIQSHAIKSSADRIKTTDLKNVILINEDHSRMKEFLPEKLHGNIRVVMFNLGYLPSGDKSIVTTPSTTTSAINQSLELLSPNGILTVMSYTGHPGGKEEFDAVKKLLNSLPVDRFEVQQIAAQKESISPPQLFVVKKY